MLAFSSIGAKERCWSCSDDSAGARDLKCEDLSYSDEEASQYQVGASLGDDEEVCGVTITCEWKVQGVCMLYVDEQGYCDV